MRILTRYVLVEMAKVFLVSLTSLTLLMILVGVVRYAANQNLPLTQVLRLIPFILPDALRVAVPVTLLLAATSVYGRMAGSNEVVAAKALGLSPMVLLWPMFIVASLLSLVTVWLNDLAVSWGRNGAQQVIVEAVEDIAYSMLKARGYYSSPAFSINVTGVEDRTLISPIISVKSPGDSGTTIISADEAELESDRNDGVLRLRLLNTVVEAEGKPTLRIPGEHIEPIDLSDATRRRHAEGHPSTLPLRVISGEQE